MLAGLLIIFPLIAAIIVFFTKGTVSRTAALGFSVIEFVLSLTAFYIFKCNPADNKLMLNCTWVESLGIRFAVGIDGLSLLLVILTAFLVPLIILSSFKTDYQKPNSFYGLILLMQMALIGVFMANDGFLFYVFWELALIPIYFICLLWGGENRNAITFKFFIYTLFGSLFMLIGLIFVYQHTGAESGIKSWAIQDLYRAGAIMSENQQSFVFWTMFLAFAIKMPVFPFHTWQPDTYTVAPTQGTMLLSGIMLKMGTFGLIKWLLPLAPLGLAKWGNMAMWLSIFGIFYASCIAIVQKDYKRLIAYSSIAHVGLISAGILSCTQQGIQGAIIQMLAHGVNVVGLFLIADILLRHVGTREIGNLGGIRNVNPQFAVLFLIILLGAVALPLTNGFVGEFLLIGGVYIHSGIMGAVAGLTIILGAVYMLRSYQGIMLGETVSVSSGFGVLAKSDKMVLVIVCVVILAFGVYPKPLNDVVEPAVKALLENIKR
jgi:NADH-quinone oxidoreductase subunit M